MSTDDPRDDSWDEALAALGAALNPVTPRPIARDRLLRAAAGRQRYSPEVRESLRVTFDLSDDGVGALIDRINTASAWVQTPLPGVSLIPLSAADLPRNLMPEGPTRLVVRIEPGLPFPEHEHLGDELMVVLEGALSTDTGEVARAGACVASPPGSRHALRTLDEGDCVAAIRLGDGIRLVL